MSPASHSTPTQVPVAERAKFHASVWISPAAGGSGHAWCVAGEVKCRSSWTPLFGGAASLITMHQSPAFAGLFHCGLGNCSRTVYNADSN